MPPKKVVNDQQPLKQKQLSFASVKKPPPVRQQKPLQASSSMATKRGGPVDMDEDHFKNHPVHGKLVSS